MSEIIIEVATGEKSFYIFKTGGIRGGTVIVDNRGANSDFQSEYHSFSGRGNTAIIRLMEQYKRYKDFFDAARKLAITNVTDSLEGFKAVEDVRDDDWEAWETVSTMIEELNLEDDRNERQ